MLQQYSPGLGGNISLNNLYNIGNSISPHLINGKLRGCWILQFQPIPRYSKLNVKNTGKNRCY